MAKCAAKQQNTADVLPLADGEPLTHNHKAVFGCIQKTLEKYGRKSFLSFFFTCTVITWLL